MSNGIYAGPIRGEPLAVELHNTLYASGGQSRDGLEDEGSARAWLTALEQRLPAGGRGALPSRGELLALRTAVRGALRAAAAGSDPPAGALGAINAASARAPRSRQARRLGEASLASVWYYGRAGRADIVIASIASSAIELLTDRQGLQMRLCGAPGCVLLYANRHRRRRWCSAACGNRARQARHYRRAHDTGRRTTDRVITERATAGDAS